MPGPSNSLCDDDEVEPELEYSPLERVIEHGGVWVKLCIYRGEGDSGWLLEVEDHRGGSTTWEDPFESDHAALEEAMRAIDEGGIESFAAAKQAPEHGRRLWTLSCSFSPVAEIKRMLDDSPKLMGFHAVCGLFAAVATAPDLVPPSMWLDVVRRDHVFENDQAAQAFMGGIMALYEQVLRSLSDLEAHCCPNPNDHDAVRNFCAGYIEVALRDNQWKADSHGCALLAPMLAVARSGPKASVDGGMEDGLQSVRESLVETVNGLHTYWTQGRGRAAAKLSQRDVPIQRDSPKTGRNDGCPCGSGKKFKRCCAN